MVYLLFAILFQLVDIFYNIWLSLWVDAITWYEYYNDLDNKDCINTDRPPEPSIFGNSSIFDVDIERCNCGTGKAGQFPNNCWGDNFYLGIYGFLGITVGLLSFIKSVTMLQANYKTVIYHMILIIVT